MSAILIDLINLAGGPWQLGVLAALFLGVFLGVLGVLALTAPLDDVDRRLAGGKVGPTERVRVALRVYGEDGEPSALQRLLLPSDPAQRLRMQQDLARAGYRGGQALMRYSLIRTVLGILLPLPLVVGAIAVAFGAEDLELRFPILSAGVNTTIMLATLMLSLGFYGPQFWLRRQVALRQRAIREGFPHALDMLQVGIEAGLGFDSALARIASEIRSAQPALAEEFAVVGLELRAGKSRDQVLANLAERTGVDAIATFSTVIMQSMAFGTSISGALQIYSRVMRHKRMMAAEEKANQLPVKMSLVMVILLLPTLFLVALSPIVIRLVRMFSANVFNVS
jgi:tight adherence protein C